MIGFGMCDVLSLQDKYKDLCENDTGCLVLCSETYDTVPKKLHVIGIRLSFYVISIGIHVMYHIRQQHIVSGKYKSNQSTN
jgi:hypothetical protein